MNERIRKLMEEVVRVDIDPDSGMETIYTCDPEDFEAFAELIIQECANFTDPVTRKLMMKHFGVD